MLTERDREELKEAFDDWFRGLLHDAPTCLYRDVLRDSKPELLRHWMLRKPIWTTDVVTTAEKEAEELHKLLAEDTQHVTEKDGK